MLVLYVFSVVFIFKYPEYPVVHYLSCHYRRLQAKLVSVWLLGRSGTNQTYFTSSSTDVRGRHDSFTYCSRNCTYDFLSLTRPGRCHDGETRHRWKVYSLDTMKYVSSRQDTSRTQKRIHHDTTTRLRFRDMSKCLFGIIPKITLAPNSYHSRDGHPT